MVGFLHGEIGFAAFLQRMRPFIAVDFEGPTASIRYHRPVEARVVVGPADLYPVLEGYLAGERDGVEVGYWAQILDMMPEFGPGEVATDEEADRLEALWDVLAHLGGPPGLERITPDAVRARVVQLRALEAKLAIRAT